MIPKLARSAFIVAAIVAASLPLPPALAQRTSQVQFQPGNDNAALSGTISGREYFDYVLRARSGQVMAVALTINGTNGNGSAFFNILPPGSNGEAIFNGSTSPDRYGEVVLPQDGDYTIRVYLMGNDRDTGKTVGYTVSVTILDSANTSSARPSSPSGGGSTAGGGLLPEEDFFVVSLPNSSSQLNVRNAPRPTGELIGTVANATNVVNVGGCTMSDGQQWCEVQAEGGGVRGWVLARFLRLPGPGGGENSATADDGGGAMAGSGTSIVRVRFDAGTSEAELTGNLLPQQATRYVLSASAGQELYFRLAANGPGTIYRIQNPDGSFLIDQMGAEREYRGQLYQSGDHVIEVVNTANGAQSYNAIFGIE